MLKILVKDISLAGLSFIKDVPAGEIGLTDNDVDLRSPLSVEAKLTRVGDMVIADVAVSARYGHQCARCLSDLERTKLREFHFDYEVASPMDTVDIGEDIRQEMILSIPQRVLCSKDCKGICAGCGVNLNTEKCKCK